MTSLRFTLDKHCIHHWFLVGRKHCHLSSLGNVARKHHEGEKRQRTADGNEGNIEGGESAQLGGRAAGPIRHRRYGGGWRGCRGRRRGGAGKVARRKVHVTGVAALNHRVQDGGDTAGWDARRVSVDILPPLGTEVTTNVHAWVEDGGNRLHQHIGRRQAGCEPVHTTVGVTNPSRVVHLLVGDSRDRRREHGRRVVHARTLGGGEGRVGGRGGQGSWDQDNVGLAGNGRVKQGGRIGPAFQRVRRRVPHGCEGRDGREVVEDVATCPLNGFTIEIGARANGRPDSTGGGGQVAWRCAPQHLGTGQIVGLTVACNGRCQAAELGLQIGNVSRDHTLLVIERGEVFNPLDLRQQRCFRCLRHRHVGRTARRTPSTRESNKGNLWFLDTRTSSAVTTARGIGGMSRHKLCLHARISREDTAICRGNDNALTLSQDGNERFKRG
eukprot:m.171220 g.171220  ORF g.171220 m.171220 type:complete len:441 (-) comp13347_c0_seq1:544-1866(-)